MENLLEIVRKYNPDADFDRLRQAYDVTKNVCQRDGNCEGMQERALEILARLLPLKADDETIIAVVLWEIFQAGALTDEQVREKFGAKVLNLLSSLRSISNLHYSPNDGASQTEVLRKMFLTMAKDLRVILIWLAERLWQMETLDKKDKLQQAKTARKTMNLYVPIAARLGVYRMKTSLEDLSFRYIDRFNYDRIVGQVERFGNEYKGVFEQILADLRAYLAEIGLEARVSGRVKSAHSIFRKLKEKNTNSIDQLYDIFAIRVILEDRFARNGEELVDHLYAAIGMLHNKWKPVPGRFKDYVAMPKPNGYRSLHTVILGMAPGFDHSVEIQVRTEYMHREAEYGVASHWIYKDDGGSEGNYLQSKIDWLQGLKDLEDEDGDNGKDVEIDFFSDRIFVLTPEGAVKDLPVGAVPIDFAYSVHSDLGNKCVMAKVNSAVVPLDYQLQNGDVVEILTRENASPKLRWLSLVKTAGAKSKIKAWFNKQNSQEFLREGRRLLNEQLERIGKPALTNTYSILKNFGGVDLSLAERETLVAEVGKGAQQAHEVIKKVFPPERPENGLKEMEVPPEDFKKVLSSDLEVVVGGESGLPIRLPACCKPKAGDKIFAYVTRGNSLTIHRDGCHLLNDLDQERMFVANWKGGGFSPAAKISKK